MIHLIARVVVAEGEQTAFLSLAKKLIVASRKEDGCLSYGLHKGTDQNTFFFVEDWRDQKALETHHQTEHFSRLFSEIKKLLIDKSVEKMTPLDV